MIRTHVESYAMKAKILFTITADMEKIGLLICLGVGLGQERLIKAYNIVGK